MTKGWTLMLRGLYAATSNLKYNTAKLDTVSNNIANMSTYGFKKDDVFSESLNDMLIRKQNGSMIPGQPTFAGVTATKMDDGQLRLATNSGYFRTETSSGISNNREMMFGIDGEGYLSTIDYTSEKKVDKRYGNRVIGSDGNPVSVGVGASIDVDADGNLLVGGEKKGSLLYKPASDAIGTLNGGIMIKRSVVDFSQGNVVNTNEKTDFALNGPGFFAISTPIGTAYTRNGSFRLTPDMHLTTTEGYRVQGINGDIGLKSTNFGVNSFGEIVVDGQVVDKIKTVNFENKGELEKAGATYFVLAKDSKEPETQFTGSVMQGSLENANVDSVTEMVKMVTLYREYESGQKLVKAYDDTLTKAVTEIGRV
jgi:flagellar basal-body rod protein FlgF